MKVELTSISFRREKSKTEFDMTPDYVGNIHIQVNVHPGNVIHLPIYIEHKTELPFIHLSLELRNRMEQLFYDIEEYIINKSTSNGSDTDAY